MKFYNFSDSGYTYGSRGGFGKGTISPNGTIGISVFLFFLGMTVRYIYKKEKIERIKERQKEIENETNIKK